MPYSLKGRNVLVTGGSRGLGALICQRFAAEGCNLSINYNESLDRARQVATAIQQSHPTCKTHVVQGDVGQLTDCQRIVRDTLTALGGLDIIVSNAGWTKFVTFGDLDSMTEAEWDRCWAVNCKAHLHLLREACQTFKANAEGGVFLTTSSTAGVSASGSSMPYSVTKAAGLHLVKCLAATQGPKVRVNAVLPGLLLTEWGAHFTPERIQRNKDMAFLKKETGVEDTADMFVTVAKNSSMTGQFVQIDSGLMMLGRNVE